MIHHDLDRAYETALSRGEVLFVRHGNNKSGADRLASCWVYKQHSIGNYDVIEDPIDADWERDCNQQCNHAPRYRRNGDRYCPVAGNLRNQAMIDKGGIDEVHAYPLPGGTGTGDCVRRAVRAGLVVTNHGYPRVTMEDMLRETH